MKIRQTLNDNFSIGLVSQYNNIISKQKQIEMSYISQTGPSNYYASYYLTKAKTKTDSHHGSNAMLSYGSSTAQGWRLHQEDAHLAIPNLNNDNVSLFAVMDGHNGPEVALYASKNLPHYIIKNKNYKEGNITKCLEDSFLMFDESITSKKAQEKLYQYRLNLMKKPITERDKPGYNTGCTCVLALVKGSTIYVANAGDSRCVLSRKGKAIPLSTDHKPEDLSETTRIQNAGGTVTNGRINRSLNVSRAFGDHDFKNNKKLPLKDQMVSSLPDVRTYQLNAKQDEFMVLACDGIWNSMENHEVISFVRKRILRKVLLPKICEQLILNCISPISPEEGGTGTDNMSCIVVKFDAIPTKLKTLSTK